MVWKATGASSQKGPHIELTALFYLPGVKHGIVDKEVTSETE